VLESAGFSVWWDRQIQAGVTYDRVIEASIAEAKCVVVVWSATSVESEYVRSEVEEAAGRNILIPVLIDDVKPPLAHRRRQAVSLVGWHGNRGEATELLVSGVASMVNGTAAPAARMPRARRSAYRRWAMVIGAGVTLLALIGYAYRETLLFMIAMNFPALYFGAPLDQHLAFTTSADGTKIAYATVGSGPPIVQVLSMNTHLERGQSAPIYDNDGLMAMSSRHNTFVMYDGRGDGLSDRNVQDFSLDARVSDIEAVVDAAGLDRFAILGVSAGGQAAIAYTARHPERVARLVLAGAYAAIDASDPKALEAYEKMLDLFEVGWDRPEVSGMYAQTLIGPDGDAVDVKIMAEFLRRAIDGPDLARFQRAALQIDVTEEARNIGVPTLVMQSPTDPIVNPELGRKLAALIPGAKLELVEGGHMASSASTVATRRRALDFLNGR